MNGPKPRAAHEILLPFVLVIAILYFGREFFIPLALAILISFLLAPVIKRLDRWKFSRITSVLSTTLVAFLVAGGLCYVVADQLIDLANELPKYKSNLQAKVAAFRVSEEGPFSRAARTLRDVTNEATNGARDGAAKPGETERAPEAAGDPPAAVSPEGSQEKPVPVAVVKTAGNAWDTVQAIVWPLLGPLATATLVIVFVIFILINLEDLRDRVIHLIGHGHLQVTTKALDDAGRRVSRYLLAQLIVNVTYGIPIGVGLYFIGVPNAVLWGLLAVVLRFIPYIGPWIAAAFPLGLSLAVAPGWNLLWMTLGLFIFIEVVSNNVVEPWLYGSSTGLSPVAIIAAATFWTWLWGAVGLLLATPLTVCIAVLGKYLPSLSFLDVLLGDTPPIAPKDRFYQRLLAEDAEEICDIAENFLEEHSLEETFELLIIPALRLCEDDFKKGVVSSESREEMHRLVRDLVLDIGAEEAPEVKDKKTDSGTPATSPLPSEPPSLICLPACNYADELIAHMLARLLAVNGIAVQVCPSKLLTSEMVQQVADIPTRLILVSALAPRSVMPASLVCKRLRQNLRDLRIYVGLWGDQEINERRRKRFERAEADAVFVSLTQAEREIVAQARAAHPPIQEKASELAAAT